MAMLFSRVPKNIYRMDRGQLLTWDPYYSILGLRKKKEGEDKSQRRQLREYYVYICF